MGEIKEKKVMGWYGRCPECVDLPLADLGDTRYVSDEIQKIGDKGTQWSQPWKPGTKEDETGLASDGKTIMTPELYDTNHNPLFNTLECGNAYFILHTKGTGYEIPNFVPDTNLANQLVVDECCGDKVLELEVFCKCDGDCSVTASDCEGWDGGELLDACERLRVDGDETSWTEPLKLWYDPEVQSFLGIGTQLYASKEAANAKELPTMSTLSGKYVHVKQGDEDSFLQIDTNGQVTDVVKCDAGKRVISIKTCKHDDYGWILMASEGGSQYKPLYTKPGSLSLELMPGNQPVEVVDVPKGWTVQTTGDYIDDLEFATAVTTIWGVEDGGTRYLKIKEPGGEYEIAYYHTTDGQSSCEDPNVSTSSVNTLLTENLFCFDGSLNDGTKVCELPSLDCCSGFDFVHTISMDPDEHPEGNFPMTIDGVEYSHTEFHDKFLNDSSPDYQGSQWMGWMELYRSHSDLHPNKVDWNVKSVCHDDISVDGGGSMNPITIYTTQYYTLGDGSQTAIKISNGILGFTIKNEGEVVVKLHDDKCYHACIRPLEAGEELMFVPIDEDVEC